MMGYAAKLEFLKMTGIENKIKSAFSLLRGNSHAKRLFDTAMYMAASFIPMILNLAINPLLAQNLSPSDYAIIGYYKSFNLLISPLIIFYLLHYYAKIYFEVDEGKREMVKATIFKALILFSFALSLLSLAGLSLYCLYTIGSSNIPIYPYIAMTVLALPLTGIYQLRLLDYKMTRRASSYFSMSIINGVLQFLFNLIFVVYLKTGAFGALLVPGIVNMIFFIIVIYLYRNLIHISFNWQEFRTMVKFCCPLTFAAMLGFFFNGFDRVLLANVGDVEELGIYVVGVQIGAYISVFQSSLSSTFQPDLYKAIVNRNFTQIVKIISLLVGCTVLVVLIFVVMAPYIIGILTANRYIDSTIYARIAAISVIPSMLYYAISQATIVLGKTHITLLNKILSTVLSFFMFKSMIENYDFIGAAWGLSFALVICLIGNVFLLSVYYRHKIVNLITK